MRVFMQSARFFSISVAATTMLLLMISMHVRPSAAQSAGTVERVYVNAPSLAGNLSGDPDSRYVSIYLPPGYGTDLTRRYPVVYMLHGFTDTDAQWMGFREHWINLPEVIDASLAESLSEEMIVVMPDAFTRFHGSMYSSSVTNGDWEGFITEDLVAYIDTNYRTIPSRASRGLAGHSMGGYGTLRIAMKYPEVFSSIYALSPCCLTPGIFPNPAAEEVTTVEQIAEQNFFTLALLASSAAWAPNPQKPPFYMDLPTKDGEVVDEVAQKFAANAPLVMLDQYIFNIRELEAIALDAGTNDMGISQATAQLHERLDAYGVAHQYESYEGDHLNRIAERIRTKTLPFFTEHLEFQED